MIELIKWNNRSSILFFFLALMMAISLLSGCSFDSIDSSGEEEIISMEEVMLDLEGSYTAVEEVALYLHQYGELPPTTLPSRKPRSVGGWPVKEIYGK